jgi:hypothetical protein
MIHLLNNLSHHQADLIKSFAIFYLILVGNYVGNSLFMCFQINYIKSHKWLQLVISFLLFYFLVSLVSDTGKLEFTPPIEKLIYSIFYFFGFLLVMRLDLIITWIVLTLIFIIYFIELNKEFYLDKGTRINNSADQDIYNRNKFWITFDWPIKVRLFPIKDNDFVIINKVESIMYYVIIFLLVIGVVSYGGEIHDTVKHSKNMTWVDVFFNTNICHLKERKSFWHYLKIGLGLKL